VSLLRYRRRIIVALNKEQVEKILREADRKWFKEHTGEYKYSEHIEFVADYLSRHYRERRPTKRTPTKREILLKTSRAKAIIMPPSRRAVKKESTNKAQGKKVKGSQKSKG
jgi:phage anti-repressor protein